MQRTGIALLLAAGAMSLLAGCDSSPRQETAARRGQAGNYDPYPAKNGPAWRTVCGGKGGVFDANGKPSLLGLNYDGDPLAPMSLTRQNEYAVQLNFWNSNAIDEWTAGDPPDLALHYPPGAANGDLCLEYCAYPSPDDKHGCTTAAHAGKFQLDILPEDIWAGCGKTESGPNKGGCWLDGDVTAQIDPDPIPNNKVPGTSSGNNPVGAPAMYPSIIKGVHWGNNWTCSRSDDGTPNAACADGETGTHYSKMPIQVKDIYGLYIKWAMEAKWDQSLKMPDDKQKPGMFDAALDIWFDYTKDGANPDLGGVGQNQGLEIMVWVDNGGYVKNQSEDNEVNAGSIYPIGTLLPENQGIKIDGVDGLWDVWTGMVWNRDVWKNGYGTKATTYNLRKADGHDRAPEWRVVSFVKRGQNDVPDPKNPDKPIEHSIEADGMQFIRYIKEHKDTIRCPYLSYSNSRRGVDCKSNGRPESDCDCINDDWWLTSVQAGFEVWQNGTTLASKDFHVEVITQEEGKLGGFCRGDNVMVKASGTGGVARTDCGHNGRCGVTEPIPGVKTLACVQRPACSTLPPNWTACEDSRLLYCDENGSHQQQDCGATSMTCGDANGGRPGTTPSYRCLPRCNEDGAYCKSDVLMQCKGGVQYAVDCQVNGQACGDTNFGWPNTDPVYDCVPSCEPGKNTCSGSAVSYCDERGAVGATIACPAGKACGDFSYAGGDPPVIQCIDVCPQGKSEGDSWCSDRKVMQCHNGTLSAAECIGGTCTNGKCIGNAPPATLPACSSKPELGFTRPGDSACYGQSAFSCTDKGLSESYCGNTGCSGGGLLKWGAKPYSAKCLGTPVMLRTSIPATGTLPACPSWMKPGSSYCGGATKPSRWAGWTSAYVCTQYGLSETQCPGNRGCGGSTTNPIMHCL